jgi:hypothetical protein
MKIRKLVNSVLVIAFMAAVFGVAGVLIRKADEQMVAHKGISTESTGTESVITYSFENGSLIARLAALGVAADPVSQDRLQGGFGGSLINRRSGAIILRDIRAVSRGTGETLRKFRFSFEPGTLAPGYQYAFSGTVPVSPEFFNTSIRSYDVALRIVTDAGVIEVPLDIYSLEVEPAIAAGLLTTNQVTMGDSQGAINFMNCERGSAAEVCEPILQQMGLAPF